MNRWRDLTAPRIRALANDRTVAVLPIGAVEQHGAHLPTGTDSTCAEGLVEQAVSMVDDQDRVVLLPPFSYGYSHDHHGFPGTISLPHRVMEDVIVAILTDVLASGFRRMLVVNGHGSNDRLVYYALRTVRDRAAVDHLAAGVTYWKAAPDELRLRRVTPPGGMAHAGELETSLMLHFAPTTVRMEHAEASFAEPYTAWRGDDILDSGRAVVPERFMDRTSTGVVGDPTSSTADAGADFAAAIARRLAALIVEMPTWPLVSAGTTTPGT